MAKSKQGLYIPSNINKFINVVKQCKYRSSWELAFFKYCDKASYILKWGSECIQIPYITRDWDKIARKYVNRKHIYYPDLFIQQIQHGRISNLIVEIKPYNEAKYWIN